MLCVSLFLAVYSPAFCVAKQEDDGQSCFICCSFIPFLLSAFILYTPVNWNNQKFYKVSYVFLYDDD